MTDIATLSYSVDSSGLAAGERALDSQTKAAERTAAAAENLGDRYREIARRGVAYAEAMRQGNVSERAQAEAAREAALGIDVKAEVMRRAGTQAEQMAQRVEAIRAAEEREARIAAESARQKALQEINLRKLLGQIDPTVAKLERLGQLEGNLERALDAGAIRPEIFSQYQAKIDATRSATLNMGKAQDIATASVGRLNLSSVEAQQSIASLARSMATGQWGMATSSITSLTARTGVMGTVFSGAGLAVGGAAATLGLFVVQAGRGYIEARQMESAIIGTGSAAGVTTGKMLDLRNEIGRATGDYGGATDAINQLLLSGKLTGEMLESEARSAAGLAKMTGQSIGSIIGEIESLADGGEDALLRLNEKYGFLTLATYKQIQAVRDEKGDVAALSIAITELERTQTERARKMEESAGWIERAWRSVKTEVLATLQAMKDVGRTDLEHKLQQAIAQMQNMKRGAGLSDPESYAPYVRAREEASRLMAQVMALDAKEADRARKRKAENDAVAAEARQRKQEAAAADDIERQIQKLDGVDTAVNRLDASFMSMEKSRRDAMIANGTYARLLDQAMAEDEKRNAARTKQSKERAAKLSEEEKAVERILSKFENQNQSLTRQIALYGDTSRSAAMAYDIQAAGLDKINSGLSRTLQEQAKWLDFLDDMDALQGVWESTAAEHKKIMDANKKESDKMSEYARQAARNMQSHFADFLFDPFAEGTRNMGKAFSETLRRMLAEAEAAKFFEMIGGAMSGYTGAGSGWINAIGGLIQENGKREFGGPVASSGMYRVGERNKPELLSTASGQFLIPGDGGRVDPIRAAPMRAGGNSGPMQVVINNNGANQVKAREERRVMPDGSELRRLIVDIVADDMAGGGKTSSAAKGRFGLRDAV